MSAVQTEPAIERASGIPRVGDRIPAYGPVVPGYQDSVRWAVASGDLTAFHFDPQAAAAKGFDRPVVHGPWKSAVLRRVVRDWLGDVALTSFATQYRSADLLGDALTFGGEVSQVERGDDGTVRVHLDLHVAREDGTVSVTGRCVAVVPEPLEALPLDRLRRAVHLGEVAGVFTYPVTAGDIADFIRAVTGERVDPATVDVAPPTFYAALDPVERRDLDLDAFLQELPFRKTGGGNAFNEISSVRPIRAGDVVTVTTRYTEVYEKKGSRGTLLFRVRENELTDAAGRPIGTSRCGHVLSFDLTSPAEEPS